MPSKGWDKWCVKFDVRDLGGHLDTTSQGWSATLAARVRLPPFGFSWSSPWGQVYVFACSSP